MQPTTPPACPEGFVPRQTAINAALGLQDGPHIPHQHRVAHSRLADLEKRARQGIPSRRYAPWTVRTVEVDSEGQTITCYHLEDYRRWALKTLRLYDEHRKCIFYFQAKENPVSPIAEFLEFFQRDDEGQYKLNSYKQPPPWLLEYLASHFEKWYAGKGSLDNAFDVSGIGSGKKTPKEKLKESQRDAIRMLYKLYLEEEQATGQDDKEGRKRGDKGPWERAISRVAEEEGMSFGRVRDLVHRSQSDPPCVD